MGIYYNMECPAFRFQETDHLHGRGDFICKVGYDLEKGDCNTYCGESKELNVYYENCPHLVKKSVCECDFDLEEGDCKKYCGKEPKFWEIVRI